MTPPVAPGPRGGKPLSPPLHLRAVRRAGHADPFESGRGSEARVRADQGHRTLRRRPPCPRHALRGADPARGPGAHRVGGERRPPAPLPADRHGRRSAAHPPGDPTRHRGARPAPASGNVGAGVTDRESTVRRRAGRLLSCYPREWRARYGEEFTELLVDDIDERPHSFRRGLDVARGGIVARLAVAGLGG